MTKRQIFLDTSFVQALYDQRDQYHNQAKRLFPLLRIADRVLITEAILMEIGNALSNINRMSAIKFIENCYNTKNIEVVGVDTVLLGRAVQLYAKRLDKTWGLIDCVSFVVMQDYNLNEALTADHDFIQAGFRALLLENN